MRQCDGSTDRAMTTHAEIAGVVEEKHTCNAVIPSWLAQQCADKSVRTTRLEYHHLADMIELAREPGETLLHCAGAKIRSTFYDDPRRFAFSVRVDNSHTIKRQAPEPGQPSHHFRNWRHCS